MFITADELNKLNKGGIDLRSLKKALPSSSDKGDENQDEDYDDDDEVDSGQIGNREDSSSEEEDSGTRRKTQKDATKKNEKDIKSRSADAKSKKCNNDAKETQVYMYTAERLVRKLPSNKLDKLAKYAIYAGNSSLTPAALKTRRTQIENNTCHGLSGTLQVPNKEYAQNFKQKMESNGMTDVVTDMTTRQLVKFARVFFESLDKNKRLEALNDVIDEVEE
jgi:hypothetical protein